MGEPAPTHQGVPLLAQEAGGAAGPRVRRCRFGFRAILRRCRRLLASPLESPAWGPVEKALQPKEGSRSRFAHHYRLNGRMYAYMLRTWNWFFTPGVVCTALGFVCLILGKFPGENVLWAVIGCALVIFATPLAYRRWRPRLGIDD